MRQFSDYIRVSLVGAFMGIAEAIPGVSGGTIAFIFKIYQELLDTIKSFTPSLLQLLFKGKFKELFQAVNGSFLLALMTGMGIGLVSGVFGVHYLLEYYKEALWAFFMGLVLASAFYLGKDVPWNGKYILFFLAGAVISFGVTLLAPTTGNTNLLFIFFCGVIAISALMLPGLSGSFILLLLGMYTTIIGSVKGFLSGPALDSNFYVVLVFGAGCLVGVLTFSRVLSYTFKKYMNPTMAVMIGILVGSLNKLWPWKLPIKVVDKDTGSIIDYADAIQQKLTHTEVISEVNMLPGGYSALKDPQTLLCIIAFLIGMSIILMVYISDKTKVTSKTK